MIFDLVCKIRNYLVDHFGLQHKRPLTSIEVSLVAITFVSLMHKKLKRVYSYQY